jgi:uncharacterized membrane protein YwaF
MSRKDLPLHACSILIWLAGFMLILKIIVCMNLSNHGYRGSSPGVFSPDIVFMAFRISGLSDVSSLMGCWSLPCFHDAVKDFAQPGVAAACMLISNLSWGGFCDQQINGSNYLFCP